jgi:hypothetical protein
MAHSIAQPALQLIACVIPLGKRGRQWALGFFAQAQRRCHRLRRQRRIGQRRQRHQRHAVAIVCHQIARDCQRQASFATAARAGQQARRL